MLSREAVSVLEYASVCTEYCTYICTCRVLCTLYIDLNSLQQRMTEFLLILRAEIHDDFTMG